MVMQHPNDRTFVPGPSKIFVFGSNDAGIHGAGAARVAREQYGAEWGIGEGPSGSTYAIPTKTKDLETKSIPAISLSVLNFLYYAMANPKLEFFVTRIGCGLAGYTDKEIAPLFVGSPPNVILPIGWENPETLP
jgi:hypothetical protein